MTGPVAPAGDDLRERLAEAYRSAAGQPIFPPALDALLPVVEAYARRRAAEELRAAAEDWPPTWAVDPSTYMRDRADALTEGAR